MIVIPGYFVNKYFVIGIQFYSINVTIKIIPQKFPESDCDTDKNETKLRH